MMDIERADAHEIVLYDVYWLIRAGEANSALHFLDGYLIRNGINPEAPFAGRNPREDEKA